MDLFYFLNRTYKHLTGQADNYISQEEVFFTQVLAVKLTCSKDPCSFEPYSRVNSFTLAVGHAVNCY